MIKTIADLEQAMRETGVQVVAIRAPGPKGITINVRETEMHWWDKCKPHKTLAAAIDSYFGTRLQSRGPADDLEDLLG